MKKSLLYLAILLSPTMAKAQWSITPEIGVLFSNAPNEGTWTLWGEDDEFYKTGGFSFKTGYSAGCKAAYKLAFGLKFSSGLYYTNERYQTSVAGNIYTSHDNTSYGQYYEYGSLSIPVLLGYDYYFGNILLSANVGAAYNYGLTFKVNDCDYDDVYEYGDEYSMNAINILADIGGGYKISEKLILKLMLGYSQRMDYMKYYSQPLKQYGKIYHIGIKVGVEILL
jgi:hypothetical protein